MCKTRLENHLWRWPSRLIDSYIQENIVRFVREENRTIIVLSCVWLCVWPKVRAGDGYALPIDGIKSLIIPTRMNGSFLFRERKKGTTLNTSFKNLGTLSSTNLERFAVTCTQSRFPRTFHILLFSAFFQFLSPLEWRNLSATWYYNIFLVCR